MSELMGLAPAMLIVFFAGLCWFKGMQAIDMAEEKATRRAIENLWSELLESGYLTIEKRKRKNDELEYEDDL